MIKKRMHNTVKCRIGAKTILIKSNFTIFKIEIMID